MVAVSGLTHKITSIEGCGQVKTSVSLSGDQSSGRSVTVLTYNVDISELYPVNKMRNYAM